MLKGLLLSERGGVTDYWLKKYPKDMPCVEILYPGGIEETLQVHWKWNMGKPHITFPVYPTCFLNALQKSNFNTRGLKF